MSWTEDELRAVTAADELSIAPVKRDGGLRGFTIIWAVREGDDVYVRAAYGPRTGWHRVARAGGAARVRVGGLERDVTVEAADPASYDAVDAAYRDKYGRRYASIVDGITTPEARATTLRLTPA
ncbi:DUF2255 family protein [Solirubrobacter soli]|uniref:DUF2255 family protein n=1 Tax=Solirubrobacter soli TaxID=363832 RepID=UPI00041D491D|nr:DUF2255 family protein [Solirubrobacter soli]